MWGYPNKEYTFRQNLGRKIHLGLQYERFFNRNLSLITGIQLASRGYSIISAQSHDLLMTYRVINIPLLLTYGREKNHFWNLRYHAGVQIGHASSIPLTKEKQLIILENKTWFPQAHIALELIHRRFSAPFSFELSYSHGFKDIINHYYLALDYQSPIPIRSNGSAFSLNIKYLIKEIKDPAKPVNPLIYQDRYDQLMYRAIKDPVKVNVKDSVIKVCVVDDQTQDGDSIVIEYNNRIIFKDILLSREGFCFELTISQNQSNTLIVHALNEGKIPPNTCVVWIGEGENRQLVNLRSDLKTSGAIRFSGP